MKHAVLPLFALVTLAACGSEPDENADPAAVATEAPLPLPSAPLPAASGSAAPITQIPAAMLGRWGLVPADCDPARADNKGLMTVEATRLRFYESVGTLDDDIEEHTATRIRADFDFTGEGQTWDREMTMELQDDGRTLVRQEFGDDAIPGALRYSKCS